MISFAFMVLSSELGYGFCHACILALKALIFLPSVTRGMTKVTRGQALLFVTFCVKKIQKSPLIYATLAGLLPGKMT